MIDFDFIDIKIPGFNSEFFVLTVSELLTKEGYHLGEISVVFCSDDYLLDMNTQYLNHDYYTDIITFDYSDNKIVSGDLFISFDRVKENAISYAVPTIYELCRVIYHGILHLCGYNDKSEEEKLTMRGKENEYLDLFVSRETF
jgi:rRNA maturation RNase YbeY